MKIMVVILAAGQGVRMHSSLPKVMHPLLGRPLIDYCVRTAEKVTAEKPVVVVGHGADLVMDFLGERAVFVNQQKPLGTGHAVLQTSSVIKDNCDLVLVITADMPLLTADTLTNLIQASERSSNPLTMLTVVDQQARGFGRVVRDVTGRVTAIVEEAQATPEQLMIRELNPSIYCFRQTWLWSALKRIPLSAKGEYYLTDVVAIAVQDGFAVESLSIDDPTETIGVNTRLHLAEATKHLRARINSRHMNEGVTIIDPNSALIEPGVNIGNDTTIWPNTLLQGNTKIGDHCTIGPNTIIRDTTIGNHCKVYASVIDQAELEDDVDVGPFAHLRKGTYLSRGVHMGNFGEIKNSRLGIGTKMGHFSYIGDALIGERVNIGAGTITCNYDGDKKNVTEIGDGVFIGSDTMLVAPVKVGEGARTGAGAVVTKDVPAHSLVVGMPARVIRKLEKRD